MKKIFFILLFNLGFNLFGQQQPLQRYNSAGRVGFSSCISTPGISKQVLYNKAINWFSNCSTSSVGNITILEDKQISFTSKFQNEVVVSAKVPLYTVMYNLSILISENQASLLVKDFVFFSKRDGRKIKRQNKGTYLLTDLNNYPSKPARLKKIFYRIADSLTTRHLATLSKAVM